MINNDEKNRMKHIGERWASKKSDALSIDEYIEQCYKKLTSSFYGWNEEEANYICKYIRKDLM